MVIGSRQPHSFLQYSLTLSPVQGAVVNMYCYEGCSVKGPIRLSTFYPASFQINCPHSVNVTLARFNNDQIDPIPPPNILGSDPDQCDQVVQVVCGQASTCYYKLNCIEYLAASSQGSGAFLTKNRCTNRIYICSTDLWPQVVGVNTIQRDAVMWLKQRSLCNLVLSLLRCLVQLQPATHRD